MVLLLPLFALVALVVEAAIGAGAGVAAPATAVAVAAVAAVVAAAAVVAHWQRCRQPWRELEYLQAISAECGWWW